jgi:hypothetical protein
MNISPAPLTEGQFAVPEAAPKAAADTDTGAVSSAAAAQPEAALSPYGDAALFGAPVPEMDAAVAESGLAGEPLPAARGAVLPDGFAADYPEDAANEAAPANSGANPAIGGATPAIGGGGEAVTLGEWNGYTLAWRENDPTDPDKLPYPVTLDIVESATSGLVCQIDIGEMTSVTDFLIEGDSLVLIGASGAGITVNSYSGYESFAPVLTGSAWQPGRYVTARFYQGAAYIASHSPAGEAPPEGIPVEALEGSLDEGTCYIGAVDVASGASGLLGLQNAGEEVNLFERHAYLSFTSPGLEEGSTEIRVATITLDGISLALERVD